MDWLKNGLSNSTATWKFVLTPVPFNMGNRFALDTLIKIGNGTESNWIPSLCFFLTLPTVAFSATKEFADCAEPGPQSPRVGRKCSRIIGAHEFHHRPALGKARVGSGSDVLENGAP